jgi:nitrate reductase NapAB chaperone NapD
MVVTVEEVGEHLLGDTIVKLNNLKGVLSAAMVYHRCENDTDMIEEEGLA